MSGPKPIEQLLKELHQGDFATRSDAARELGKSRDPRAVEALLPDLNDQDWRVRRNAAQALGALKAKTAVEPLIRALKDRTMTVRLRAAVALWRIKDPAALPALAEALGDREGEVAYNAAQALRKFGKAALPALPGALAALSGPRRLALLELLVDIPGADFMDDLRSLLKDPDRMVRMQAIRALSITRDPRAVVVLVEQLSDPDLFLKGFAAEALGQFKDPRVAPALLSQLTDYEFFGPNHELYRAVTGAMQKQAGLPQEFAGVLTNSPAALAGLLSEEQRLDLNLMISQSSFMMKNLGAVPGFEQPALRKFLGMLDQVRGAGNTSTRLVDALMGLLNAPDPLVRAAAALSLVWYQDARALAALSIAKMDRDEHARQAAAWAYETLRNGLSHRSGLQDGTQ